MTDMTSRRFRSRAATSPSSVPSGPRTMWLRPCEPLPASPELAERRFDQGRAVRSRSRAVNIGLEKISAAVVVAAAGDRCGGSGGTRPPMPWMVAPCSVIAGGRLPTDHVGKRVGKSKPCSSSHAQRQATGRPVDVKHHMIARTHRRRSAADCQPPCPRPSIGPAS